MKCKDMPDRGSTTGLSYYTWNNKKFFGTNITYNCKIGQAFEDIWKRSIVSTCDFQHKDDVKIFWKFNDTKPLPKCVRKYFSTN